MRTEATTERRLALTYVLAAIRPDLMDASELVSFHDFESLDRMRRFPPDPAIEGVMLKRKDAAYVAGRTAGLWYKWKKAPMTADVVLMYAQRGHGKRSGLYSDFTFGAWTDDGSTLLPVGKAYFGFTDKELAFIDRYVRENTIDRFGPVRSIKADAEQGLVFEIEFEGIGLSGRHKSGIALRFPRISRIRQDKPPREADTIASMKKLIA
jgi:DNA ligase-1